MTYTKPLYNRLRSYSLLLLAIKKKENSLIFYSFIFFFLCVLHYYSLAADWVFCLYRREPWPRSFRSSICHAIARRDAICISCLFNFNGLFIFLFCILFECRKKKEIPFSSTAPASSIFFFFLPKDVILVTFSSPPRVFLGWIVVDFDTGDRTLLLFVALSRKTNERRRRIGSRCRTLRWIDSSRKWAICSTRLETPPKLYVSRRVSIRFEACHELRAE